MEPEIKKAAYMAARIFQAALKNQSPVGERPRTKEAQAKYPQPLKQSIVVKPIFTEDSVKFQSTYNDYGKFVDLGTGRYKTRASARRAWNPKPGKGTDGIKPRFWTTVKPAVRREINRMISDAFTKVIRTTLYRQK
jgi:hypothetical protein